VSNYRVATNALANDPLAVDPVLAANQHANRTLFAHVVILILTVGAWLPVLVWVLFRRREWAAKAVEGYSASLREGQLFVGTRATHTLVPLDQIRTISTQNGIVTVSVYGRAAVTINGLADPLEAARTILAAHDEHASRRPSPALSDDSRERDERGAADNARRGGAGD
jgi:hypothetical protein